MTYLRNWCAAIGAACLLAVCLAPAAVADTGVLADAEAAALRGDHARAIALIRPLAEQGIARAQYNLAISYVRGEGVERNDAEAGRWFRRAAEQGFAEAQNMLGLQLLIGAVGLPDPVEASRWLRLAADQGVTEAQNRLGTMYRRGEGVSKDEREALSWYRRAAETGYAPAQGNLGLMYALGQGTKPDQVEGYVWLDLAVTRQIGLPRDMLDSFRSARDRIATRMTSREVADAQRRAAAWVPVQR